MRSIRIIGFCILCLTFLEGVCFAKPGIKITQPQEGTVVAPGQEITVTVEAVEGFEIKWIRVGVDRFRKEKITSLPATIIVTIPLEVAGKISIRAFGVGVSDPFISDNVTLLVQQTATLQSLEINQDKIWVFLDWNGNITRGLSGDIVTVYGNYSDGIKRILDGDPGTIFTSSDSSVISIDTKGTYQVHKVGEAAITVSNSGVSKVIPVVFKNPTSIRPSETIPPTVQMNIQPPANQAGWNNTDITITLTAQDNEGGSGIREIVYSFPNISAESNFVENNQAVIPFSKEETNLFRYGTSDKEGNDTGQQSTELRLDKTLPSIALELRPIKPSGKESKDEGNDDDEGNWYELLYSATDNLSGLKKIQAGLVIPALTDYKIESEQDKDLEIRIDEKKKELKIKSPDHQGVLIQLQSGLLTLTSGQSLQLKLKQGDPQWKVKSKDKGIEIQAPAIVFKAKAEDIAGNAAVEKLEFAEDKH